jgi:PAS domain S-box-containing protein
MSAAPPAQPNRDRRAASPLSSAADAALEREPPAPGAHEALAARERQLREAQRVAQLGSWEWDPASGAISWSEEMYRIFGVPPGTHLTRAAIGALLVPEDRAAARQLADQCASEARPLAVDLRVRRGDGRVRVLHARGDPIRDAAGRVLRIVGTVQDVTERRRTDELLRGSQQRLRTLTAHREAILEEERARIAREIHDELGEMLTMSKLDLAWIRDSLLGAPPEIRARLDELAGRVDSIIKTVRRIATELRPVVLDQLGLAAATEWQVRDFAQRTHLLCSTHADIGDRRLPPETATGLFRILQEALTNIARHACATTVRVDLRAVADMVCLEVVDDGRGIVDPDAPGPGAMGIVGMRERALLLGGALELGTVEPSGTRLSVWAPIHP